MVKMAEKNAGGDIRRERVSAGGIGLLAGWCLISTLGAEDFVPLQERSGKVRHQLEIQLGLPAANITAEELAGIQELGLCGKVSSRLPTPRARCGSLVASRGVGRSR